jgi:hypothetical protein
VFAGTLLEMAETWEMLAKQHESNLERERAGLQNVAKLPEFLDRKN